MSTDHEVCELQRQVRDLLERVEALENAPKFGPNPGIISPFEKHPLPDYVPPPTPSFPWPGTNPLSPYIGDDPRYVGPTCDSSKK